MSTKAFDKIAAGLKDALAIARGEEQPALVTAAREGFVE
jgi:hypothetical protein